MRYISLALLTALAGCGSTITATAPVTSGQASTLTTVASVVASGQLVCKLGPANLVALIDPSGAAILAKGNTAAYVAKACAAINGVAVSPPTGSSTIATVSVSVPAS